MPSPSVPKTVSEGITYPAHTSRVLVFEQANGPIGADAVEGRIFAATRLVGSTDGREITEEMKEPVFIYPVDIDRGNWTVKVFFGKDEEVYRGLVFALYLFEADPETAASLRAVSGQAARFSSLEHRVRTIDAHGVIRY